MKLIITTALKAEAISIIRHFKLKNFIDNKFEIFSNEDIFLIITKVGSINSAIATAYIATLLNIKFKNEKLVFLNIGIAGHKDLSIGSCILAHEVRDEITKIKYFPSLIFDFDITKTILCVSKPSKDYLDDFVFDMESFGFFVAASKFCEIDLIQSLKIISDNLSSNILDISKEKIEDLIFKNLNVIEKIIFDMFKVLKSIKNEISINDELLIIQNKFHLTFSEQNMLSDYLFKIKALKKDFILSENILSKFITKKDFLDFLKDFYMNQNYSLK
jgi:adenosylhomocysteine nucleosidase